MKIGYVCTNYNNSEYTAEALRTLLANDAHEYFVIVVDNCSDESNAALLRSLTSTYPQLSLVMNDVNVGYFRGLNIGIKRLRANHPDVNWMVVGNNDLIFPADFADKLADNAERLCVHSVISPDVITVDGEHQNPHVISRISTIREIFYDLYFSNYHLGLLIHRLAGLLKFMVDRPDEDQWRLAQPIYQGHGSCYLLGPRFFKTFEELWAPTFLMSEEFFLSKQLSDVGQQVYYDPSIQVIHHWHASLAKVPNRKRWEIGRDAHREYRKYVKVF